MSEPKKHFLNFPLFMLAKTHTDPTRGMNAILDYALCKFAQSHSHDYKSAFIQAVYQSQRHPDRAFTSDVLNIMSRGDVVDFAEDAVAEGWCGHPDFTSGAAEMFKDSEIEFESYEQAALVSWLAMREAASLLGWVLNDFDGVIKKTAQSQKEIDRHAHEHGTSVWAGCPSDYFNETYRKSNNPEAMRLFRCVVAVRSLVGAKQFTGTTKDMIRARMIGGKSPAVAEVLADNEDAVRAELDALASRKRFARILTEGAVRRFYVKYGAGRRLYLSTATSNPDKLAAMVSRKFSRHKDYTAKERRARHVHRGQQGGSKGGTEGGSFNKSLNKSLNKALENTSLKMMPLF